MTYFVNEITYYYISIYNSHKYVSTLKWKTILFKVYLESNTLLNKPRPLIVKISVYTLSCYY